MQDIFIVLELISLQKNQKSSYETYITITIYAKQAYDAVMCSNALFVLDLLISC